MSASSFFSFSHIFQIVAMLAIVSFLPSSLALPSDSTSPRRSRSSASQHQHQNRQTITASGYSYKFLGCAIDGTARALTGSRLNDASMTLEKCFAFCGKGGFGYAGLEAGTQCFCGNQISNGLGGRSVATACNAPCGGNKATICGGSSRLSLYFAEAVRARVSASVIDAVAYSPVYQRATTATSLGCWSDAGDRTLPGDGFYGQTTTPDGCIAFCKAKGWAYAGVESGDNCMCGNSLPSNRKIADSKCNKPCTGDSTKICGGDWALNAYVAGGAAPSSASSSKAASSSSSASRSTSSSSAKPSSYSSTSRASSSTSSSRTSSSTSSSRALSSTSSSKASSSSSSSKSSSASSSSTSSAAPVSTGVGAASVVGAAAPPAGPTKALYAHHMVGNTYSYTQATWADDISQAYGAGFDGFALNMGGDAHEPNRAMLAYRAAEAHGKFKVFFSLDVTSLGCSSAANAANLASIISTYTNSSAQAKINGKTVVSTFAGEYCNFGQGNMNDGWTYFRSLLVKAGVNPYIIPSIFSDPSGFSGMNWMDGEFNWNSAWPMSNQPINTASDRTYANALGSKGYMPAISPAFFTYYSPQSYNKNWIYRGDDWLLATRMEQLIALRNDVVMAELISWNDYGESHYVGPIRADQPNSQGWTNGMPHTAWLSVIKYYAPAFKTGSYPSSSDLLVLWSRPHPKAATASAPSMDRPRGWDNTDDSLYVFVVLSSSATVTINSGNNVATFANLPAGPSKLKINSAAGAIGAKIVRGGASVKSYDSGSAFQYTLTPKDYNFNYFVGQA